MGLSRVATTADSRWSPRHPDGAVFWLIVVTAVARLILAGTHGLGMGESYYLESARHLAWSYFDQPPLSLWLVHVTQALVGGPDPFWLRLPFIMLFAGTTWLLYALTARLFTPWAGVWAALALNLSAVYTLSVAIWLQPDGPLMFFWLAAALMLVRVLFSRDIGDWTGWLAAGVFTGLALLAKYHSLMLIFGAFLFVVSRRDLRGWLLRPQPWVATAIALAFFAPVVIWNAQHDWASFVFQSQRSYADATLRVDWLIRSILGQAVWLLPWIWVPMIWVFVQAVRRGPREPRGWFLVCTAVTPIAFFTIVALWAPLGFHFHWQAPGYLMLFPLLGRAVANRLAQGPARSTRAWLWGSAVATVLAVAVLGTHAATGVLRPVLADLKRDPTLDVVDWTALRAHLDREGWLDRDDVVVITDHWLDGGKVGAALGHRLPVLALGQEMRNLAFTHDPTAPAFQGRDALLITSASLEEADLSRRYGPLFAGLTPLAEVPIGRGGVAEETVHVRLGRDFRLPMPLVATPDLPARFWGQGWGDFDARGRWTEAGAEAGLRLMVPGRTGREALNLVLSADDGPVPVTVVFNGRELDTVTVPAGGRADVWLDPGRVRHPLNEVALEAPRPVRLEQAAIGPPPG